MDENRPLANLKANVAGRGTTVAPPEREAGEITQCLNQLQKEIEICYRAVTELVQYINPILNQTKDEKKPQAERFAGATAVGKRLIDMNYSIEQIIDILRDATDRVNI